MLGDAGEAGEDIIGGGENGCVAGGGTVKGGVGEMNCAGWTEASTGGRR
jgi:hypothetical protein